MRIAVDATPLLGHRTGVGAFTLGAVSALSERPEVEVLAYALSWRGRDALTGILPRNAAIITRPMAARPLRMLWAHASVPAIEWWTGPVDVVHGTNFVVPPTRRAVPVVTVHDLTPMRFPELCQADTLAYPGLVRRAIERGAWVHTPSRFVADEVVERLGADPARVVAVPHGVPGAEAIAAADPDAGRLKAGGHPYVLALGTVEPRKDLPSLVSAFSLLCDDPATDPDLVLVLAGPDGWGSEALSAALDRLPSSHRNRVVRIGYVSGPVRDSLIRGAAVFAYPSVYEGFGLPPLEAMAGGVPVVATDSGPLPEVLGDAAAFVAVGDPVALAGAITRLVALGEHERAAVVERGREHAAGFTWEACADGLVGLYERAIAADRTGRSGRRAGGRG